MNLYLTCLGLAGLQITLARSLGSRVPRLVIWLCVMLAIFAMHTIAMDATAFVRMITLCTVLMAGMKWIVYREWSSQKDRKLSWTRWWIFSTLWFGMEPGCFAGKRRQLEWRHHAIIGMCCILVGGVLWYSCYLYQVTHILLLFVPMSMVVHFGALRVTTAFWRMLGFPVRSLFRNPLAMRGFRDFWSKKWNLAYSEMMARTVKQPLTPMLGEKWSVFAVFLVSGLLHELAITVPVQAGYGLPTLFFIIHGIFSLLEKQNSASNALLCALLLIVGLPYLFNSSFQTEIIFPSRDVFTYLTTLLS